MARGTSIQSGVVYVALGLPTPPPLTPVSYQQHFVRVISQEEKGE